MLVLLCLSSAEGKEGSRRRSSIEERSDFHIIIKIEMRKIEIIMERSSQFLSTWFFTKEIEAATMISISSFSF